LDLNFLIQIHGLTGLPLVKQGDSLGDLIVKAAKDQNLDIQNGDVLVVAQKIVSKAEGRVVDLRTITPSSRAEEIAKLCGKDPRHVELILRQSVDIVRNRGPHLIVETPHGFVCANAGVDRSNIEGELSAVLLPEDPDRSARQIREQIRNLTGADVAVIVSDTFGRAWRIGQTNVAIGADGLKPVLDYRGSKDMFGMVLNVTQIAIADELASSAELVMGKSNSVPVALIRGYKYTPGNGTARELLRPKEEDLFR